MASAYEAEQLAAVTAALQTRDVVSIARLTHAANSATVSKAGCEALEGALTGHCVISSEEALRAVEAVVWALRAHPASAGVQERGCRGLAIVCKASADAHVFAGAGGAVEAVTAALRTHAENGDVQEAACYALAFLTMHSTSQSRENCNRAHRAGALETLLDVMRSRGRSTGEKMQVVCCKLLKQMCEHVAGVPALAVQLGALTVIIAALWSIPDNLTLQEYACSALVAALPEGSASRLSEADAQAATLAVFATMSAQPKDSRVVYRAGKLLAELTICLTPQCAVAAAESGGMEAVARWLHAYTDSELNGLAGNDVLKLSVSIFACSALARMAIQAPAHRHRACAAGAVAAVVSVLQTYPDEEALQELAAFALAALCQEDAGACAQATQCCAVKLLVAAVYTHEGAVGVLQYALHALNILVLEDATAAAEAVAAGPAGIGAVMQLLLSSTPQQDGVVLIQASMALAHTTEHDADGAAAVSSTDAVTPFLHVLQICADVDPNATRVMCQSLHAVLQCSPAHAAEAAKRGAASIVDAAAHAHPADEVLQRCAAGIRALLLGCVLPVQPVLQQLSSASAAAEAREQAERRAAAMADALIAEEEASRTARAAPPAPTARKRRKKKRGGGGGGAADAEGGAAARRRCGARAGARTRLRRGSRSAVYAGAGSFNALCCSSAPPPARRNQSRAPTCAARRRSRRQRACCRCRC